MKILVIGSGGREHAIVKKLKESKKVTELFCAPGNAGISKDATCVDISAMDIEGVCKFAKENKMDIVFVAPDDPLAAGMVDALENEGIKTFGPRKNAAILEASKVFSKDLMEKYNIPTASYKVCSSSDEAISYIKENDTYPIVVKADGLALGKGVIIAEDFTHAQNAVKSIMEDKVFGTSGNNIVIEEFMTGPEVTVLAFTDSKTVKPMVSSKDHKRALDGNKGLNTGGMGTICPNPDYTKELAQICMKEIFMPTIDAMNKEGRPFKGCLYFGLMLTPNGPRVIEYNARFGDPETQVVLPLLETDLVDIIEAIYTETLESLEIKWKNDCSACVVMASGGYPENYDKGKKIDGLNQKGGLDSAIIYHAGTALKDGNFVTNGGRVLGITALGNTLDEALDKAYAAVKQIDFKDAHYRKDIGRS